MRLKTIIFMALCFTAAAAQQSVPFDNTHWQLNGGQTVKYKDKTALMGGHVMLKEAEFSDGTIEVDMIFTESRGFAGINFRIREDGEYEHFYIRPHKSGLSDALQYTPVFNGLSSWQIYNGPGYTAGAIIPKNEWIHIKLTVKGSQARIYLNNSDTPSLTIDRLQHGKSIGQIGLFGPANGLVHYANFQYQKTSDLQFNPPAALDIPLGFVKQWELCQPMQLRNVNTETCPDPSSLKWKKVLANETGIVDIARHRIPIDGDASVIYAKTSLNSDKDKQTAITFGYSDVATIFVNGQPVFHGNNAFRTRDPAFLGIMGRFDQIYLPLKKGRNEIVLMIAESFGGWGFTMQLKKFIKKHPSIKQAWQHCHNIDMPESVIWDEKAKRLFIAQYGMRGPYSQQSVSTMDIDGNILEPHWVTGFDKPCGMILKKDKLYVVERRTVAVIDVKTATIEKRLSIPRPGFPNDITMDDTGNLYITDSYRHMIFISDGGDFTEWLDTPVYDPNGINFHDGIIVWGNNGDNSLKSINLKTNEIKVIAELGPGNIDGIQWDKRGFYLVTHFSGRLYKITPDGKVITLLNTTAGPLNLADFCYIPEYGRFIMPSLFINKLTAFNFDDNSL